VVVGSGSLALAVRSLVRTHAGRLLVVVSDARVARLYGRRFAESLARGGARSRLLTFPAGERRKTRETKSRLEDRLVREGAGRDTIVVALGGGVTGDLAGFLAATWHRGVPVVQIPTSLLAMVDAALGGKTAVDLPGGKNAVGAFHQPESVWADVRCLRTLPDRDYRAGLAEVVKTAAALDATLFGLLEARAAALRRRDERLLERIVARCLAIKGRVVAADERDSGPRAILNFGHTVAHALEGASGFRLRHGEAVAIGLVLEARVARARGAFPERDLGRLERLLVALGLPTSLPRAIAAGDVVRLARRDKKTRGGVVRYAVPARIGRPRTGPDPTEPLDVERDLAPLLA